MDKTAKKFYNLSNKLFKLCAKKNDFFRKCLKLGRMECKLLILLADTDKIMCMNEISGKIGVSHSRVTRIIDKLEEKELVKRYPSKEDRRKWLAEITDKGEAITQESRKDIMHTHKMLLKNLPKNKIENIYESLELYVKYFEQTLKELAKKDE